MTLPAVFAFLLIANACLQWGFDKDLGIGWPHNVIRNWEDYGLLELRGQLVTNPGGHGALDQPDVYRGHHPASLYPAYVVGRLFSWTGFHMLPFYILLAAVVLFSIWHLLGGRMAALCAAGVIILSPAYIVRPTIDPNTNTILAAFPYFALLLLAFRKPHPTKGGIALILVLTFIFTSMNWIAALIHAQIFVCLLCMRSVSRRSLLIYACAAGLAGLFSIAGNVVSKVPQDTGTGGFLKFLADYTWGSGGYARGSDAITLLRRLAFINALALLPLWCLLGYAFVRRARQDARGALVATLPLWTSVLEALGMRNYFCHHPWMTSSLFMFGGVLSLMLLFRYTPEEPSPFPVQSPRQRWVAALAVGGSLLLSAAVLAMHHAHQGRQFALTCLVRHNTDRRDVIAILRDVDPGTAAMAERLPAEFDRKVVVLEEFPDGEADVDYVLSAIPLTNYSSASARTRNVSIPSGSIVQRSLTWFVRTISRRKPGDRLAIADTYWLYPVPQTAPEWTLDGRRWSHPTP